MYQIVWTWQRTGGYEVSSRGDSRYSALYAYMPDGRTIEQWYQCDIKGYDIGGTDWAKGKGKEPLVKYLPGQLYQMYLALWRVWAMHNPGLLIELYEKTKQQRVLSDRFASNQLHSVNQARALAQIMNEWVLPAQEPKGQTND